MNEFVEECRREWKRLRVPDPVANEMAADLEADLREAEAEGSTPEDVLGTAAFDPRSFAASWAIERGVAGAPEPTGSRPAPVRSRWRMGMLVGLAGVGLVAIVAVMGVALAMHPFGSAAQAAIASPGRGPVFLSPSAPSVRLLHLQAHDHDLRDAIAGAGLVLVLGVAAAAALVMLYFSPLAGSGGRPGRRRHPDETPDGC